MEGKGEEGRRSGGGECRDGVLTFWMVSGRPTSGEEARSDWTAPCGHDSHVSLKTSLTKSTFYDCFEEFSPEYDPLVGRVLISEILWFPALV